MLGVSFLNSPVEEPYLEDEWPSGFKTNVFFLQRLSETSVNYSPAFDPHLNITTCKLFLPPCEFLNKYSLKVLSVSALPSMHLDALPSMHLDSSNNFYLFILIYIVSLLTVTKQPVFWEVQLLNIQPPSTDVQYNSAGL